MPPKRKVIQPSSPTSPTPKRRKHAPFVNENDSDDDDIVISTQAMEELNQLLNTKADTNTDAILKRLEQYPTESTFVDCLAMAKTDGVAFDRGGAFKLLHYWARGIVHSDKSEWKNEGHQMRVLVPWWDVFKQHGVEKHVNRLTSEGASALHLAVAWGSSVAAKLLLTVKQTDINIVSATRDRMTPLMDGIDGNEQPGTLSVLYCLMLHHFDTLDTSTIRNANGATAADMVAMLPGDTPTQIELKSRWEKFVVWKELNYHDKIRARLQKYKVANMPHVLGSLTLDYVR